MRKLAEFVQLNCTSSISIANFRLQAHVISTVYSGFDAVNNYDETIRMVAGPRNQLHYWFQWVEPIFRVAISTTATECSPVVEA